MPKDTSAVVAGEAVEARRPLLLLDPRQPMQSARELVASRFTVDGLRTLHHHRGEFYCWDGAAYRRRDDDTLRAEVYAFLDGAVRAVPGKKGKPEPFAPNRAKVGDVQDALRAVANLRADIDAPSWLDPVPDMNEPPTDFVVVQNGLLHLPTLELRPPTPAFFATAALPVRYDPDALDPARWLSFLEDLWPDDPESIESLQELFGLALVPDTSHQKIFLMVGPKRSGKGTVARVLTALIGPEAVAAPTLNALSAPFGLAPLIGKQLATITDARLGARADQAAIAERLLSISGEDTHNVDRKFLPTWIGRLAVRFLILTNEIPRIADASGALASRFVVLLLRNSFYGREDHGLAHRLLEELPGIFLWSLAGLARLRQRGYFRQPASAADAVAEMEALGSPIIAFVREKCIVEPGASCDTSAMFESWRAWCATDNRRDAGTVQTFGRNLRAAVPGLEITQHREADGRRRQYQGITLIGYP